MMMLVITSSASLLAGCCWYTNLHFDKISSSGKTLQIEHEFVFRQIKTNFMYLPLVAVHHFCLTKLLQKTPNYSAIYQSKRHLTVFYIAQIVPSFVVLYLNAEILV